jgi:putative endonuclease
MTDGTARRRAAFATGLAAESLAAWALRLKGYRVLARRHRNVGGEIDLIARRGTIVAFVEVKARGDLASAAESVSPRQRERIRRAAELFVAGRPDLAGCDFRFDAVLVAPGRWPRHIVNAWHED